MYLTRIKPVIPDRLGNHRVDVLVNILTNPNIGLMFVVHGHGDTLRIAGIDRILKDRAISEGLSVYSKEPILTLVREIEEAIIHCSISFIRTHLWHSDHRPPRKAVHTRAE